MMTFGVHASELGCKHHFVALKKHQARISSFLPSHPDFRFLVSGPVISRIRTSVSLCPVQSSLASGLPFFIVLPIHPSHPYLHFLMSRQSFPRILSHDFTGLSVVFGVRFGEFKRKIH